MGGNMVAALLRCLGWLLRDTLSRVELGKSALADPLLRAKNFLYGSPVQKGTLPLA